MSEDSDPKAHLRGWLVRRRKLHLTLGLHVNHRYTDTGTAECNTVDAVENVSSEL